MVASYPGAADSRAGRAGYVPAERLSKPSSPVCGPMMQQGTMGAHGHEMHPQGFLRLVGCHETNRQRQDAEPRLHV
ncbi:MAG TPA: hypothetical protein VKY22_07350 [Bradyrhizobium sp.]|nr:hypothetical protein [Bradyrhizobium sp.]